MVGSVEFLKHCEALFKGFEVPQIGAATKSAAAGFSYSNARIAHSVGPIMETIMAGIQENASSLELERPQIDRIKEVIAESLQKAEEKRQAGRRWGV